ncbi:MAG: acyltransferase [Hydrogenophaga sp.]|uniref:acyltransferase family protein n=1 Tax=Hydrogenophaga sp. TaxID=1904254 RepID=UPI001D97C080|nr:acyltransferase [Hydrogenophaga sp.]MBX3608313.1 acyltransferase [Hydrogenophaga sp.]
MNDAHRADARAGVAVAPRTAAIAPGLSTWLDLARVIAAFMVYVGHAVLLEVTPSALSLTWWRSADDAVIAFFVLSGFVIAATTRDRHASAGDYALARLSRVYSVALPALVVALALDLLGQQLSAAPYADYLWKYDGAWRQFVRHWLFLGEGWLGVTQPFTVLPYWSLAYEVWYYLLFGVCMFARGAWRWLGVAVLLVAMGPWMLMLLPLWWLGVLLSRRVTTWRIGPVAAAGWVLAGAGGYALLLVTGWRNALDGLSRAAYAWVSEASGWPFDGGSTVHVFPDYAVALLFAMVLTGCAHLRWTWPEGLTRVIRWLADHSFSFYLMHFPALVFAQALGVHRAGWLGNAGVLAGTLLLTLAVAQVGERRRGAYRRAFARLGAALSTRVARSAD